MTSTIKTLTFEVSGKVQGVFFRKYTKKQCTKYGITGWVLNTHRGTVQGLLEGTPEAVDATKTWLKQTGSPKSKITNCVFTNDNLRSARKFKSFSIIRDSIEVEKLSW